MAFRAAALAVSATFVALLLPVPLWSQTLPRWPTDQEKRLNQVDAQLLEVQRERFHAIFFADDKEAVKRLDDQFRSLQKERRALIDATDTK